MAAIDELADKCFKEPECQPDSMAWVVKQAIQVSYPDIEQEVDIEGLNAVANTLVQMVSGRITSLLAHSLPRDEFTVEEIVNYSMVCERMKLVRQCVERMAGFIVDYNNWKYNY